MTATPIRFKPAIASLTVALVLSGIAIAASAPAQKTPIDACSLLSTDEISAVIGTKIGSGSRDDSGAINDGAYSSTCMWKLPGGESAQNTPQRPFETVSFAMLNAISWPAGSDGAQKYLQSFYQAAEDKVIPNKPVPIKLGDEALWWGDGVAVRKGNVSYGISVRIVNGTPEKARAMAEALAKKIIGRV